MAWEEDFLHTDFEDELHELKFLKDMMKAAAQYSRDYLQDYHGEDPFIKSQQLAAIARTVFMQSHLLLETLLKHSPLAREHLEIIENKIHIKNMQAFKDLCDIVNTQLSDDRYSAIVNQKSKDEDGKLMRISDLAKLWIPVARRYVVSGIKIDADIIRQEPELTLSCGQAWQPTFDLKEFDEDAASTFLNGLENLGNFTPTSPPLISIWIKHVGTRPTLSLELMGFPILHGQGLGQ